MNIQPLNYNFTRRHRYRSDYDHTNPKTVERSAGLCDNKMDNNITFSGSQDKSVAAANTFMGKILKSGAFNWLAEFSGAHNIASSALIALFLAGLLRPAATVALPGKKDKDDKIYAAGHSMASGIIGFIFSTVVTSPLDSGSKFFIEDGQKMSKADFAKLSEAEVRKILEEKFSMTEEEIEKCIKENKAEGKIARRFDKGMRIITSKTDKMNALKAELKSTTDAIRRKALGDEIRNLQSHIKAIDTTMHNVVDWGIAVPRAMLTIALIPPILKYVFRLEKKKPAAPKPDAQQAQQAQQTLQTQQAQSAPAVQPAQQVASQNVSENGVKVSMKDFIGGKQ